MTNEELIQKALDLTEDHEARHYGQLSDVNWVEQDDCSMDYDYCDDCIGKAVYSERREYLLEQRKLPINLRDSEFSKFEGHYNYGGGYEDDSFACCEICGRHLNINILPNEQVLEDILDDLKDGKIDDLLGWEINSVLYNAWEKDDKRHSECWDLSLKIAKRTIEILEG